MGGGSDVYSDYIRRCQLTGRTPTDWNADCMCQLFSQMTNASGVCRTMYILYIVHGQKRRELIFGVDMEFFSDCFAMTRVRLLYPGFE